jgi:hypothetical protein
MPDSAAAASPQINEHHRMLVQLYIEALLADADAAERKFNSIVSCR